MKWTALLLVPIAAVASVLAQEGADKELKRLSGTWTLTSGEEKGEKLSAETLKASKLVLDGNKHDVHVGKVHIVGTHKVDPSTKPASIDATDTEGPYKGQTVKGIYKLEVKKSSASKDGILFFTVCFAPPGKDRPSDFTTKSGTAEILHVWMKKK